MSWNYDSLTRTWTASDVSDLNMTSANNLIVHGQPYQPSDGFVFDPIISSNFQSNPTVNVQMPQRQIMEFGYGSGVQVSDFGLNSLLGDNVGLADGVYSSQDLRDSGLLTESDFRVSSQLYTPGLNIADGGVTAAYVHGKVQFRIGDESQFIVQNGVLVEIQADLRAFDDNFNFESDTIPDWMNAGVQYTLGPGSDVPEGAIVLLQYNGEGRLEIVSLGPEISLGDVLNALQSIEDPAHRETVFEALTGQEYCFLATTPILMADGSEKPIEHIKPGDLVKSYNKEGNLVAGRVKQTFVKEVEHVLDFFGTGVTPGHVYYCGAGKYKGQHVPLIDILRDDGGVVAADGTLIRAATGTPIGSENDVKTVWAVRGEKTSCGGFQVSESKKIRLSTRVITEAGNDLSVADILKGVDASVNENAMIQIDQNSGVEMPFHWTFSEGIPKPEDYVLSRRRAQI